MSTSAEHCRAPHLFAHSPLPGLIINNKHFTCNMKDRVGTDRDADSLVKLFLYLGFYTNRYDDLKGTDMRRRLQVRGRSPHYLFILPSHSACLLPPSGCGWPWPFRVWLSDGSHTDPWYQRQAVQHWWRPHSRGGSHKVRAVSAVATLHTKTVLCATGAMMDWTALVSLGNQKYLYCRWSPLPSRVLE